MGSPSQSPVSSKSRVAHSRTQPSIAPPVATPSKAAPAKEKTTPSILPALPPDAPLKDRIKRTTVRLLQGLYIHDAFAVAPAMAFHFFLSLLPLLVVVGFLVGHFVRQKGVDAIMDPILDAAPESASDIVKRELERLAGTRSANAGPAIAGFLWLASSGIHGLMNAFETAVKALRRPWWKKRLIALAWVVGSLGAVCLLAWSLVKAEKVYREGIAREEAAAAQINHGGRGGDRSNDKGDKARPEGRQERNDRVTAATANNQPNSQASAQSKGSKPRRAIHVMRSGAERGFAVVLLGAALVVGLAGFYRVSVSWPPGASRRVWPGAFVAVASWLPISWAFSLYVATLGSYALFYGSLAAVAVLLVWFWLTSLVLLVGAELNAQLEGRRDTHHTHR